MRQYHCLPPAADTSATCDADPPFPVVRLTDEAGDAHYYRLIRLEMTDDYVLYDLSQNQDQRRQTLILPDNATVSSSMRATMAIVSDTISHRRMTAQRKWEAECRRADREKRTRSDGLCPVDLAGENQAGWAAATEALRGIIGTLDERNAQLRGHGADRLFLDGPFREALLREESQRVGVDKAELKRLLFRWIRYGGDAIALMPRRGGDEAPGTPRIPGPNAVRVGRLDAFEVSSGRARTVQGMTFHWHKCLQLLVLSIVFETPPKRNGKIDIDAVIGQLKNGSAFGRQFRARCFFGPPRRGEVENRPTSGMVEYHRKRAVDENEAVLRTALLKNNAARLPAKPELGPIPGGAAVDRNADLLETLEMDATEFRRIQIVGVSASGKRKCFGYATLIVACSRSTGTIVGWYAMIGKETTDAYRKCLYWALCDKAPLLRALELDPGRMAGIVSGRFDEVVVDRGPGSQKMMQIYVIGSAKMDFAKTRPYTAVDKGTVEGANKLIKAKMHQTKKIVASADLEEELQKRYRALPVGFCTIKKLTAMERRIEARRETAKKKRLKTEEEGEGGGKIVEMELMTFMRMVTVAINALNLQRRTDELALSRDLIVEGVPPIRADMHRARQSARVADAARSGDATLLATSVLRFERLSVIQGKVRHNNVWYGAGSERPGEIHPGLHTMLADARTWAETYPGRPFEIDVAFPPDPTRLVALWRRVRGAGQDNEKFELLELPATRRSLRTYGEDIGEEVAKGLRRCLLIQNNEGEKAGADDCEESGMEDIIGMADEGEPLKDLTERSADGIAQPRSTAGHSGLSTEHSPGKGAPSPTMESRAIAGKKFDLPAWLESLKQVLTGKRTTR